MPSGDSILPQEGVRPLESDSEHTIIADNPSQPPHLDTPDSKALSLAFYAAARAEVVQRIALRESTLLAWVTLAGLLIGWAINKDDLRVPAAEVLPWVSLAFMMLAYRHTKAMRLMGKYLVSELGGSLAVGSPKHPKQWDASLTIHRNGRSYLRLEVLTFLILQVGPPTAGLVFLISEGKPLIVVLPAAVGTGIDILFGILSWVLAL
jgi:hypothetical protein